MRGPGLLKFQLPLINQNFLNMKLTTLVGSGKKIGMFTLPFLITGIMLNILFPAVGFGADRRT